MISLKASKEYTEYAIESFFRHTRLAPGDIFILILNDEHEVAISDSLRPHIKILAHDTPASFAKNANILRDTALKNFSDLYILNNDIIFTPDWAELLHVEQAAITIPLCNQDKHYTAGEFELERALDLEDYLPHKKAFEEIVKEHRKTHTGVKPIFFAPFFCVRIPHLLLDTVGAFYEAYGRGGAEDTDYALRVHLNGYSILQPQGCYLLHFMGKSTWRGPETPEEVEERDRKYREVFIEKWGEKLTEYMIDLDESILSDLDFDPETADWRKFITMLQKAPFEPAPPKISGFLYCDKYTESKLKAAREVVPTLDHLNVVAAPGVNMQALKSEISTLNLPPEQITLGISSESELTLTNSLITDMHNKKYEYTFFFNQLTLSGTLFEKIKSHLLTKRSVPAWFVQSSAGRLLTLIRNDSKGIRAPGRENTELSLRLPVEEWIKEKS